MKPQKYYVEFLGQHTAGKTTTIHEVVHQGRMAPLVAIYPQQITRSRVGFFLALPWLVISNIHHLWFVAHFLARYAVFNWINYHAVARHLFKMVLLHPYYERYAFDVWMKDDMLHLLPRIEFKHGVDVARVLKTFFNHFAYRYDGLVYVDIPYEVMRARFEHRFAGRDPARRDNRGPVYERSYKQTAVLREIISLQKAIPVLMLDGTQPVTENAQRVASFITTHVMHKV